MCLLDRFMLHIFNVFIEKAAFVRSIYYRVLKVVVKALVSSSLMENMFHYLPLKFYQGLETKLPLNTPRFVAANPASAIVALEMFDLFEQDCLTADDNRKSLNVAESSLLKIFR